MAKENKGDKKTAKKKDIKVNTMSLKGKNMEIMFSLIGKCVHIVVRQPRHGNKKMIISAFDWMLINKGMFNPDDEKPIENNKGESPKQGDLKKV